MKFGMLYELQIPKPWHPKSEYNVFWEALEQIVLAEEMGFEYAWLVEHHFLTEFAHSCAPEVFLGALSQRTSRMRLGHGVVLLPVNHPVRVAEYVATLDVLSNGRVELGTGRSGTPYQLSPFGLDINDTRGMWDEALSIIPRMWTEEVFSHDGKYYHIPPREVIPKPVQVPHPPLWVACTQTETFRLAGERGLGALCFTIGNPGELENRVKVYREAVSNATPVGKFVNNQAAAFTIAYCDENNAKGREIGAEAGMWYFANSRMRHSNDWEGVDPSSVPEDYQYHLRRTQVETNRRPDASPDELLDNGSFCAGDPDACIRTIERYEALGIDQLLPIFQAGRIPHEKVMQSIRLFGKYIIPYFQEKERKARESAAPVEAADSR